MKFLLDENIGKYVAVYLQKLGNTTSRIREINPGIEDVEVLALAVLEDIVLITSDKDFGQLIFQEKLPHKGIIFLRLKDESTSNKIRALNDILSKHLPLNQDFITISEKSDGSFKVRRK